MVRRSSRERHQTTSAYDEELKHLADKKNQQISQESDSEASDVEREVEEAMMVEDEENDLEDMEDEEEFSPSKAGAAKSLSKSRKETPTKKAAKKAGRAIQVKVGKAGRAFTSKKPNRNKRAVQGALTALRKKSLEASESPKTDLVAALLSADKPIEGIESAAPRQTSYSSHKLTIYSEQLEGVARKLLRDHEPNAMHIQLLNLLFRSVGGSSATSIKQGTDLEEMEDEEWDALVTKVVQVMCETEEGLWTAKPQDKVGLREYRLIYKEFWYRLGVLILSSSPSDGQDSSSSTTFSSNRFQVELMRDLVARVTELVLVGQPDLRSGATGAIWELAMACMERTVELTAKLSTAQRQYASSKGQSRKLQAVKQSMDSWKRHKAELEVLVEESIIQGIFIRRYRDSNPHIRASSLEALCRLTVLRPDIFLKDKYLKYMGWMASDKSPVVRAAALKGILAPFKYKDEKRPPSLQIDLNSMHNVCVKFLPRIASCTEDSQSLEVQEIAMELIVKLMNEGFLDEWDDDDGWDQLNLKALDSQTTPEVRRNALYLILDQLDSFDEGGNDGKSTAASVNTLSERQQMVRLDAIARWIAHLLCNGPVPINKIKVGLTDHIVLSLRGMPEHKSLTTSWSAMLKAIGHENANLERKEREEIARTRVLLRMLVSAANLEVSHKKTEVDKKGKRKASLSSSETLESLSQALLKNLPELLTTYKADNMCLRSLAKLPQHILPEIFSLSSRKSDFSALVKNICVLFLDCTDEKVLKEIAASLQYFVQGDHARVPEVQLQLRRLGTALRDRLMELFSESDPDRPGSGSKTSSRSPRKRSSRRSTSASVSSESIFSNSREMNVEHSISLCLLRLRTLMKQVPLDLLFEDSNELDDEEESEVEGFCNTITEALGKRLVDRKPILSEDDDTMSRTVTISSAWKVDDTAIHTEVGNAVDLGLDVLLCVVGWKLADTLTQIKEREENGITGDDDEQSNVVLRLRNQLSKLIGLCYEQYLEPIPGFVYSEEQEDFASSVQTSAGRVASDLRTLFPKGWVNATNATLQKLSLRDDIHLIGGFVRFLQSRSDFEDAQTEAKAERAKVHDLILPIARALAANWSDGNRKEAGVILSQFTSSGKLTKYTVQSLARMLKKIQPVRFLESQMAALRISFRAWLDREPDEQGDDQDTKEYYDRIEEHNQLFARSCTELASQLSKSLGVGKLSDKRLAQALLNFMLEGIRFSFEGDANGEDDLVLGSRLPFLSMLSKYGSWFKQDEEKRDLLADFLFEKETALRAHDEFNEVDELDLECIVKFREALGIISTSNQPVAIASNDEERSIGSSRSDTLNTPGKRSIGSAGSRRKLSTAGSQRSRVSAQSNLSPLLESPMDREREVSPSPQKRRRLDVSLE